MRVGGRVGFDSVGLETEASIVLQDVVVSTHAIGLVMRVFWVDRSRRAHCLINFSSDFNFILKV